MTSWPNLVAFGSPVAYGARVDSALSASAIRDVDAHRVLAAVEDWFGVRGVATGRRTSVADEPGDVLVFAPSARWTVVRWPDYFLPRDVDAAIALSTELHAVVSTMSSTAVEGWTHTLVGCGTVLDRFHSYPVGLVWDEDDDLLDLAEAWRGDPALVARVCGVEECRVRRHFCQACPGARDHPGRDPWGFVGLWSALGIAYPGDSADHLTLAVDPAWQRVTARS